MSHMSHSYISIDWLSRNEITAMFMIGVVAELFARPFFSCLTKKFSVTALCIGWTTVQLVQAMILSTTTSVYMFWLVAALNGFALGGYAGLKMVMVIECVGIELQVRI